MRIGSVSRDRQLSREPPGSRTRIGSTNSRTRVPRAHDLHDLAGMFDHSVLVLPAVCGCLAPGTQVSGNHVPKGRTRHDVRTLRILVPVAPLRHGEPHTAAAQRLAAGVREACTAAALLAAPVRGGQPRVVLRLGVPADAVVPASPGAMRVPALGDVATARKWSWSPISAKLVTGLSSIQSDGSPNSS